MKISKKKLKSFQFMNLKDVERIKIISISNRNIQSPRLENKKFSFSNSMKTPIKHSQKGITNSLILLFY